MSNIAIRVENLSKLYKIGARRNRHDTLRDHIMHGVKSLFSRNGHPLGISSQPSTDRGQPSNSDYIWALNGVSFDIKKGEVVGFIGKNGAGKSTLLKILSRITEPTKGRAEIYGRVGSLLEVGTGFHPELTGRENIYLNGAILGMKKWEIEKKFDEIVAFSEIEKFIDTPVKRYSSGMYVRLAFAVAAHLEPEILILDEVLSVGDASFQKKCLGKVGDVVKEGRTVLLVSHQMQVVPTVATRAFYLKQGTIAKVGSTSEVVSVYLDETGEGPDLTNTGYVADGSEGRFGALQFFSGGHKSPESIVQGETMTLQISVIVSSTLRDANLAIAIRNKDRVELFSHSWSDEHCPLVLEPGCHVFSIDVPTRYLRPGPYWLTLCLAKNIADTVVLVPGIKLPNITLAPGADLLIESRRWGVVQVPCHWERV